MHKKLTLMGFLALALLFSEKYIPSFFANEGIKEMFELETEENESIEEEIRKHALHNDWWLRRYADPSTGTIPTERLEYAQAVAAALQNTATDRDGFSDMHWNSQGPNSVAGHINDICFDDSDPLGNTAWIASNGGGLWKTTNAFSATAPTYTPVAANTLPTKISSIKQHPTNPNILYLSAYAPGGIWKSTDKGNTWTKVRGTASALLYFTRIDLCILTDGTILVGDSKQVLRSTDAGATWQSAFSGTYLQDIEVASNGKIYLLTSTHIYFSEDKGLTWNLRTTGFSGNSYFGSGRLAIARSNPNRIYALTSNPSDNYGIFNLFRTSNGGENWDKIAVPSAGTGVSWALAMTVNPANQEHLILGSLNFLVSFDGGTTMKVFSPTMHVDQQCVAFVPNNPEKLLIGNDGGLFRAYNGNSSSPTATAINLNLITSECYAGAIHPVAAQNEFTLATQDNGTLRVNNSIQNPSVARVLGGDGGFCHIDRNEPNIRIASIQNNVQIITNNNWNTSTTLNIGGGEFISATDYDPINNILYAPQPARNGYAYVSGVGTANTVKLAQFPNSVNLAFFNIVSAISVSPNNSSTIYLGNVDGYVFKVQNAATATPTVNIIRTKQNNARNVSCIAIEKGNENHLVVTYSNYGVVSLEESKDGGNTWSIVEGNLPDLPVNWFTFAPNNPKQGIIATDLGIWATTDLNGNNTQWMPSNEGMSPNVQVTHLSIRESDRTVLAATYGRGGFTTDFFTLHPGGSAVVVVPPTASQPNICESKSNYPWEDWISRVQIGSFIQTSGKSTYSNFNTQTIKVTRNSLQNISLTAGFSYTTYPEYWKIWIDFNQNSQFEEPQEIAFAGILNSPPNGTPNASLIGAMTIPFNASTGTTRMRVSMKRGAYPTPCETLAFGEVEDYSIQILGAFAPGLPNPQDQIAPTNIVNLYPNPAQDYAYLLTEQWKGQNLMVELLDIKGATIKKWDFENVQNEAHALELNEVENGIYVLRIFPSASRVVFKKLVINKTN